MNRRGLCVLCGLVLAVAFGRHLPIQAAQKEATQKDEPKPEMIGEGVISTPDDELGGTITADGRTLYFEKSAPPHYLYILYESHLDNGHWSTPTVLPFSGQYRDTDPVLSPDGQMMLFASDRPVNGIEQHHFYIWQVKRKGAKWEKPEILKGPVNDGFDQVFCSIAANGNLYFTSSRKGGVYEIYRSRLVDGKYQPAEEFGTDFNGPTIDTFEATIAPDESFLLIGSFGRQPGNGSSDLYISYNRNGSWTNPQNLGTVINTPARDYSPRISGDGKWLLYTSETSDRPLPSPITYEQFERYSHGLYNGLGNLYRIPLDYVLRSTQPQ
jgi:Tol biopolymer transport system component